MTEKQFQHTVESVARACGWLVYHTYDSRRSEAGFPDLTMVRRGRLVMVELKKDRKAVPTDAQLEWGARLTDVSMAIQPTDPPVMLVDVWTPEDWDVIEAVLR